MTSIDQALGLGGNEEMWIPDLDAFSGYGNSFGGRSAFQSEEEAIAAAIAASLQDAKQPDKKQNS